MIQTVQLDTSALPAAEQFTAWANHTPNSRITPLGQDGFAAQASFWMLSGVAIAESRLDPFRSIRDSALIGATGADHFTLTISLRGQIRFEWPGGSCLCEAGRGFLIDYAEPFVIETGPTHTLVVTIARDFLEEALGPLLGHRELAAVGETRILIDYLCSLVRQLPHTSIAAIPTLSRIIRDLLATALAVSAPIETATSRATQARLHLKRFIAARPPGTVTVDAIVDALGISRSAIYRMFEADGGVMAYDRRRRLRALHRSVADPLERRPLAELGDLHGFTDPAHLAHLFRKQFGYAMSTLRREITANGDTATSPDDDASRRVRRLVGTLASG